MELEGESFKKFSEKMWNKALNTVEKKNKNNPSRAKKIETQLSIAVASENTGPILSAGMENSRFGVQGEAVPIGELTVGRKNYSEKYSFEKYIFNKWENDLQ